MEVAVAERLASELLTPLGDRWRHVQAVAAAAREVSAAVDPEERDLLVAAAWLHDIGYAPSIGHLRFHPVDGARFLESQEAPKRLCALVAHHSCARYEAEERGLTAELSAWELEVSPVMDALCAADMTTGPQGQRFTFDERIAEILSRYGDGSIVHRSVTRAWPELQATVERTTARLAVVQPR
ncbi:MULTISPECIES: HD domain-containing protein [Parafrankia]|uniref:HD domain-containing protein n=1 Tax=Parafrankia TaxID=2994362 RepID=UPI000AFF91B9|nr:MULTISPECIES: HD domain-containing protein [Parafrankia]MBE3206514.1 HD domain-containing protein [Parafrankia sp. CH37]